MPWTKGQSGNPTGRPKGIAFGALISGMLDDARRGGTDRERIAKMFIRKAAKGDLEAAKWIIERADGKVKDQVDQNLTGEVIVRVLRDRAGGTAPLRPPSDAEADPGGSSAV